MINISIVIVNLHANKSQFTCAFRLTGAPKSSGRAKQHLSAIQGISLFTGEKTLGAKAEVPQRMGAVHRQR